MHCTSKALRSAGRGGRSQDILDGNDIKNRLSVVKLVNYLRVNRFELSCITHIIGIIDDIYIGNHVYN